MLKLFEDRYFELQFISQDIVIIWKVKFGKLLMICQIYRSFLHQIFALYGIVFCVGGSKGTTIL